MDRMRAIHISSHDGPAALEVVDIPEPEAQAGQVLIDVHASGGDVGRHVTPGVDGWIVVIDANAMELLHRAGTPVVGISVQRLDLGTPSFD